MKKRMLIGLACSGVTHAGEWSGYGGNGNCVDGTGYDSNGNWVHCRFDPK